MSNHENERFKQIPGQSPGGLITYFVCSYKELEAAFGKPMNDDDKGDYKTSTSWRVLDIETNNSFDIYDYKEINALNEEQVRKFRARPSYDWHISGMKTPDLEALAKFIESKNNANKEE